MKAGIAIALASGCLALGTGIGLAAKATGPGIEAWYIRIGQRDKGEELLGRALARNPSEVWTYVRAAEAYLGVPEGR